jgi:hypothetical protein
MQCACAIFSSVACPALQYFSILPCKQSDFQKKKKVIEYKICTLKFFKLLSEIFFLPRKTERDMMKNVYLSSGKVPIILATPSLEYS